VAGWTTSSAQMESSRKGVSRPRSSPPTARSTGQSHKIPIQTTHIRHFHCLLSPRHHTNTPSAHSPHTSVSVHLSVPGRHTHIHRTEGGGMPVLQPLASTDPRLNTNHTSSSSGILRHNNKLASCAASSWSTTDALDSRESYTRDSYTCTAVESKTHRVHVPAVPGVSLLRKRVTFDQDGTTPPSLACPLPPLLRMSPFNTVCLLLLTPGDSYGCVGGT
jgi:hypothetical protein